MLQEFKRAFYVFLSGLMGVLLFLVMQRSIWLLWLIFTSHSPVFTDTGLMFDSQEYLIIDSISLIISVVLGGWYGVWLGLHWYDSVYVQKNYEGIITRAFGVIAVKSPQKNKVLKSTPPKNEFAAFWDIQSSSQLPDFDEIEEEKEKVVRIKPKSVSARPSKATLESEKKPAKKTVTTKVATKKPSIRSVNKK